MQTSAGGQRRRPDRYSAPGHESQGWLTPFEAAVASRAALKTANDAAETLRGLPAASPGGSPASRTDPPEPGTLPRLQVAVGRHPEGPV
ncbi:hypothetical protein MCOR01_011751 [Pyricularia oryzae]|nr:hypothetical protein MCOR01_011751 [Pyricularia oryzae]